MYELYLFVGCTDREVISPSPKMTAYLYCNVWSKYIILNELQSYFTGIVRQVPIF